MDFWGYPTMAVMGPATQATISARLRAGTCPYCGTGKCVQIERQEVAGTVTREFACPKCIQAWLHIRTPGEPSRVVAGLELLALRAG
jgi:hypothetical protein